SEDPPLDPGLQVAFALTKGAKPERVVAQLVELGVDGILVFAGRRSVVRLDGMAADRELERLRRVSREAAMQCRRARVPPVALASSLSGLAGHPGLLVADRAGPAAGELEVPDGGEWLVVVGPEGGFDAQERDVLAGAPTVGIG